MFCYELDNHKDGIVNQARPLCKLGEIAIYTTTVSCSLFTVLRKGASNGLSAAIAQRAVIVRKLTLVNCYKALNNSVFECSISSRNTASKCFKEDTMN